ncbi:septum formation protein Maf [bacterium]|nr:septum formation protein Maf [bacterium]
MSAPSPLILASASPRRHELLSRLGVPFEIIVSLVDESCIEADSPRAFARKAAEAKCLEVAGRAGEDRIVLGADTVVCFEGQDAPPPGAPELLGKPSDPAEACRMLGWLSGRVHTVITALALRKPGCPIETAAETSHVRFHTLSQEQIARYVATGEPMDKAGAYAVQADGGRFVAEVRGDLQNVIGLPLKLLSEMLKDCYSDTRK